MQSLYIAVAVVVLIIIVVLMRPRAEGVTGTPDAALILNLPPEGRVQGQYWDGTLMQPCENCHDMRECPKCPQFALYTADQSSIESFEVPTMKPRIPSPMDHIAEVLDVDRNVITTDDYDVESAKYAQPLIYDICPQYLSSREVMGAGMGLSRSTCGRAPTYQGIDVSVLGTRNDDIFDGERAVAMGTSGCRRHITPVSRMLYKDVLGLRGTSKPAIDCEILSHNGYSYKQRCDSGW